MRILPSVALILFLGSVLPWGLAAYSGLLRTSWAMRPLPMEERRRTELGTWYRAAERLRDSTAPGAPIDIVILVPSQSSLAIEAGSVLHLRDTRFFYGWEAWRKRERAIFLPDSDAVNAVPGPPLGPAVAVVAFDAAAVEPFRLVEAPSE